MLKKYAALGAAVAALAAATVAATPVTTGVVANPSREAPRIMLDPQADNTDLYASGHITLPSPPRTGAGPFTTLLTGTEAIASNWVPLQSPAGGPYFGKLDPAAHYYAQSIGSIGLGNQGGGQDDVAGFNGHSFTLEV
jgi:hypothetical protein